jgi:protein-S-isoprenylcysteine O-methyltransferase Ste14
MYLMSVYLLTGLIGHKLLWEVLKRDNKPKQAAKPAVQTNPSLLLVKTIKIGILLGILVQAALPLLSRFGLPSEILPMTPDPGPIRTAGVALFTVGLLTAILGRLNLGKSWSDIESPHAAQVVSNGVYAYIRHPIYSGDLIMLTGLELALNSWLVLGVLLLIPVVFLRAVKEEKMLAQTLTGYDAYIQRTKRFIPFVV